MTSHCRNSHASILLLFAILLLSAPLTLAQTTAARPDRGTRPNGSYTVSDVENISLQNGNLNLNIPLASLPPIAGGKLSWSLNAYYNSKVWDVSRTQQLGQTQDPQQPAYYVVDKI